jgi:cytidyltransferase-like protein
MPYASGTIEELRQYLRSTAPPSVILTCGCFDLLHVGHLRFLQEARTWGSVLVTILLTDDIVERVKGTGRPIVPFEQGRELLMALRLVDFVVEPRQPEDP